MQPRNPGTKRYKTCVVLYEDQDFAVGFLPAPVAACMDLKAVPDLTWQAPERVLNALHLGCLRLQLRQDIFDLSQRQPPYPAYHVGDEHAGPREHRCAEEWMNG